MPLQATSGAASQDAFGGNGVAVVPTYIEDVFSTYLYTGTGAARTITNDIDLDGEGGLVWIKSRSNSNLHFLWDTARGATKYLVSNATDAQGTAANGLTAFNSNGFSLGSLSDVNLNGQNTVSWTFREQPKFFDVVTYTGTGGSPQTIAHNLGSVPGCIIVKRTDTTANWAVYHRSLTSSRYSLLLNLTGAEDLTDYFSTTAPTSSQFTVGTNSVVNASGGTYVAYLFAHDAGGFGLTGTDNVISCGSFTTSGGGGDATVNLGYEPQWLLVKSASGTSGWDLMDNMRGMPNYGTYGSATALEANNSNAEGSRNPNCYPTSTGFYYARAASTTYIYIAIRRGPMKVPTDGTSVFAPVVRTGTGSVTSYTGLSFPPDMLMARKPSPAATYNFIVDRLRGARPSLTTQEIDAEQPTNTLLTAFGMRGVTYDGALSGINQSGVTYVNHFFGRAPSYFDEVCYTGTGDVRTVTHNLGAVPELMIVKARDNARVWTVYSSATGNAGHLIFNNTSAYEANSADWNSTSPTASVFTVGGNYTVNDLNAGMVAYLFATCPGVSKVGSYTGTGTTQTINCGFTAGSRFVMIKRTDNTGDWYYWDSARGIIAGNDPYLLINSTAAEVTGTDYVDTAATGFEISSTAPAAINASGGSFIFLAIS